jgi:chorismate-pyruvate lyase
MTDLPPPHAADLTAALAASGGTVTQFLEELAGETVDADILAQETEPAGPDNRLGLDPGAELLRREVLLTGRATGRRFVYAESAIAAGRLPRSLRKRLEHSREPIGRVLMDHGIGIRRTALDGSVIARSTDRRVEALIREAPLSRRYLIVSGGNPVIVVNEWFLPVVAETLASLPRG